MHTFFNTNLSISRSNKINNVKHMIPGNLDTKPPLFLISSCSVVGSWSTDSCLATPFFDKTARESPILATINFWPLINIAVTAVEPPLPNSPDFSKILESVILYALLTASSGSLQKSGYMGKKGRLDLYYRWKPYSFMRLELTFMNCSSWFFENLQADLSENSTTVYESWKAVQKLRSNQKREVTSFKILSNKWDCK